MFPDAFAETWCYDSFEFFGVFDRAPIFLAAAAAIGGGHLIGWAFLRRIHWPGLTSLEGHLFAGAIGMQAISLAVFWLAWTVGLGWGGWTWSPIAASIAAAGVWLWATRGTTRPDSAEPKPHRKTGGRKAGRKGRDREAPRGEDGASGGRWSWLLAPGAWPVGVAALVLLWMLLKAATAPTDFDVREYHLQTPKEWLQHGGITFLSHNAYSNMPLGAEAPSLIGMTLFPGPLGWWRGALVGKIWMAWFTVLAAGGVWAIARRMCGAEAAGWATLLYVGSPWVFHVSTTGLNEGVLAANMLLALYPLCLGEEDATAPVAVSGWLTGAALACKYTAAALLAAPLAMWLLARRTRAHPRHIVVWLVLCLASGGGWYLKNAVQTGNPVFPLMTRQLGGKSWNADQQQRWDRAHRPPADALYPASLYRAFANVAWRHNWATPVLAPLCLAGALAIGFGVGPDSWNAPLARWWLSWLIWMAAVWLFATHRLERFLVPAYPLIVLVAVGGWAATPVGWARKLQTALTVAGVAACLLWIGSRLMSEGVLATLEANRRDPAQVRLHPAWKYLNGAAGPGDVSLLVGEAQAFDFEHPVLYASCFDDPPLLQILDEAGVDGLAEALNRRNVRFVLVSWDEIRRYRAPGSYGFDARVHPELFRDLERAGVLRPVPLGLSPDSVQVWRVAEASEPHSR